MLYHIGFSSYKRDLIIEAEDPGKAARLFLAMKGFPFCGSPVIHGEFIAPFDNLIWPELPVEPGTKRWHVVVDTATLPPNYNLTVEEVNVVRESEQKES